MKLVLKSLLLLFFLGVWHSESLPMNGLNKQATRELVKIAQKKRSQEIIKRNMTGGPAEIAILIGSNPATAPIIIPIIAISGTTIVGVKIGIELARTGHSGTWLRIRNWSTGLFSGLGSSNTHNTPADNPNLPTQHERPVEENPIFPYSHEIAIDIKKSTPEIIVHLPTEDIQAGLQDLSHTSCIEVTPLDAQLYLLKEINKSKNKGAPENPNPRNGNKKPDAPRLKNVPKRTTKEVQKELGSDWVKIEIDTDTHGEPIFKHKKTGIMISPDTDGHNGSYYKLLDSRSKRRIASLDKELNQIKN